MYIYIYSQKGEYTYNMYIYDDEAKYYKCTKP